jgi:hypothetical protein
MARRPNQGARDLVAEYLGQTPHARSQRAPSTGGSVTQEQRTKGATHRRNYSKKGSRAVAKTQAAGGTSGRRSYGSAEEEDDGGFGLGDITSGISNLGSKVVGKAIEYADVPFSFGRSALNQASIGAAELDAKLSEIVTGSPNQGFLGNPMNKTGDLKNEEMSWDDFVDDAMSHKGTLDYAKEAANKNPDESLTGNAVADFGAGFAGDLAAAGLTPKVRVPANLRASNVANVTNRASKAGLHEIASKLQRSQSFKGLTQSELDELQKFVPEAGHRSGAEFLGKQVVSQNTLNKATAPLRNTRQAVGDVLDKTPGLRHVRGANADLRAMARSADPETSRKGLTMLRTAPVEHAIARHEGGDWLKRWREATKDLSPEDHAAVYDTLGGARNAMSSSKISADLEGLLDEAHKVASAAGIKIGKIEDYVPHVWTRQMREASLSGKKTSMRKMMQDPTLAREIRAEGKWLGEVAPAGMNEADLLDWANARARAVFGQDLFTKNLDEVGEVYAHSLFGQIAEARTYRRLQDEGLAIDNDTFDQLRHAENSANFAGGKVDEALAETGSARAAVRSAEDEALAGRQSDLRSVATGDFQLDETRMASEAANTARLNVDDAERRIAEVTDARGRKSQPNMDVDDLEGAIVRELQVAAKELGLKGTSRMRRAQLVNVLRKEMARQQTDEAAGMIVSGRSDLDTIAAIQEEATADLNKIYLLLDASKDQAHPSLARARESLLSSQQWAELASNETDISMRALAHESAKADLLDAKLSQALGTAREAEWRLQDLQGVAGEKIAKSIQETTYQHIAGIPGWQFDPELARVMTKTMELTSPGAYNKLTKTMDAMLNYVKSYQIATPGFHMRNAFGGMWNMALDDVNIGILKRYWQAMRLESKGGLEAVEKRFGKDWADKFHQSRMISGRGQIETLSNAASDGGKVSSWIPGSSKFKWLKASHAAGTTVEHWLRGGHAMDKLLKGSDMDGALQSVMKSHFDYGDLTRFERNVVKRIIPFYTWSRKNIPLQAEMLIRKPSQFAKYGMFAENLGAVAPPVDWAQVPEYYTDIGATPTPLGNEDNAVMFSPASQLPLGDLMDVTDIGKYQSMVTPWAKAPVEIYAGKQFFKGLPLTGKLVEAPRSVGPFMPALRALGYAKGDKIKENALYAVTQFIPLINQERRLLPKEKKYQERMYTTWANFAVGAGLRTVTDSEKKGAKYFGAANESPQYRD